MERALRTFRKLLTALPVLALACSGSLPKELAVLDPDLSCPVFESAVAGRKVERTTPIPGLQCTLRELRGLDEPSAGAATLATRLCFYLADSTKDRDRARLFASEGVRWAELAVRGGADQDGAVHYYLATNLGLAVKDTILLAMKNLDRLKAELELAEKLAPDVDGGGPGRVLALLYLKVPSWPKGFGDSDLAVEMLRKAVAAHPEHPQNALFLASALWDTQESAARDEVAALLTAAERAISARDWGYAAALWRDQIAELRKDAGL